MSGFCLGRLVALFAIAAALLSGCAADERPPFAPKDEGQPQDGGRDEADGGGDDPDETVNPVGLDHFVISDKVEEWGATPDSPPKICAGGAFSCGITPDGNALCWGDRRIGILAIPDALKDEELVMITCGEGHACVLTEEGDVRCWGSNSHGQSEVPEGTFKLVEAGGAHTCAIDEYDEVVCWGAGKLPLAERLVGDNHIEAEYGQSIEPRGKFRAVSAGYTHTCAIDLKTDEPNCWGDSIAADNVPEGKLKTLSAGYDYSCGITFDDELKCWGVGTEELNNPGECELSGVTVVCGQADPPEGKYSWVATGTVHTCAITLENELACWGDNEFDQLDVPKLELAGVGSFTTGYTQVDVDVNHTCAITAAGVVECWGYSGNGKRNVPADAFD